MLSPTQIGDAALGQVCEAAVHVIDRVLPGVSKYWLHWETTDDNLGPIIPEWAGDLHKTSNPSLKPPKAPAPAPTA